MVGIWREFELKNGLRRERIKRKLKKCFEDFRICEKENVESKIR